MDTSETEAVRAQLIDEIKRLAPSASQNPTIARALELGTIDELRKQMVFAKVFSEVKPVAPVEYVEPEPRSSEEVRDSLRFVLTECTGNGLPVHHYVMAADEIGGAYDGPTWVPFNLWSCYKYEGQGEEVRKCAYTLIYSANAERLWSDIAARFDRPDNIAAQLPGACWRAVANWQAIPRVTPAEWKKARESLARKARQLATELERFFLPRDADANEFPGLLDFTQLLDDDEMRQLDTNIRRTAYAIHNAALDRAGVRHTEWDNYNGNAKSGFMPAIADVQRIYELLLEDHYGPNGRGCVVPMLPNLMRRIANMCEADADDPPLSRPNASNAQRNHFARALIKYFRNAGDASPTVIADIVTMFYPQGMDANEVSQLIRKTPRWQGFETITSPETSPLK